MRRSNSNASGPSWPGGVFDFHREERVIISSDPWLMPTESEADAAPVAKSLHQLLDIIALLVVKDLEKDRIEKEKGRRSEKR